MNVFELDEALIGDYERFARSFTLIRAPDIRTHVEALYAGDRFADDGTVLANPNSAKAHGRPWVGRAYVTFLAINRLGEREILAMIEGVIGNKLLPANIRQDIIQRTDGIHDQCIMATMIGTGEPL